MKKKNGSNGSADVVVVDDSTSDVYLYRHLFEKSAYKLHFFNEFSTAIEFIESANPICIVVDDTVPDTEKEATEIIKYMSQDHPVIVVSHNNNPKAIKHAMEAGAFSYLNKGSLTIDIIERAIQTAVRGKNMRDGIAAIKQTVNEVKSTTTIGFVKINETLAKLTDQITAIESKQAQQYDAFNQMNAAILVELRGALDRDKKDENSSSN